MKKIILIFAFAFIILLGVFFSACSLHEYKAVNSINLSDSEEVIGEIHFIGLPDGTPFVSFYDKDNNYHSDIPIHNVTIRGELKNIEKHYGEKYKLKFDAKAERVVSTPHFLKMISIYLILILLDVLGGIFVLLRFQRRSKS